MKSIIQYTKKCFRCENPHCEDHHIFFGTANRKLSEKYGLKIWLCESHHRLGNQAVHKNKDWDLKIKRMAQKKFMEHYDKTREDFIKIFGKNYL